MRKLIATLFLVLAACGSSGDGGAMPHLLGPGSSTGSGSGSGSESGS